MDHRIYKETPVQNFSRIRTAGLGGVAALSLLAVAACGGGGGEAAAPSTGPAAGIALVEPGALTVCTHLSYKPFEFKDSSNEIVGFDIDVMDLVAEELGVKQKIVDIDFASMTSGAVFAAKKCDAALGAVTITEARQKAVLFSDPYFEASQALLAKTDSGITDLASLKGKKLGVQTDTTGQQYAQDNKDANGYEIVVFEDAPSQLAATLSGRVDAAMNDNGLVFDYAKENTATKVVKEFNTGEKYGFMVQKDNESGTKLAEKINDALTKSKDDGKYDEIYKKWFDSAPKE